MRVASAAARDALERLRSTGHPTLPSTRCCRGPIASPAGLPEWESLEDRLTARTDELMTRMPPFTAPHAEAEHERQLDGADTTSSGTFKLALAQDYQRGRR